MNISTLHLGNCNSIRRSSNRNWQLLFFAFFLSFNTASFALTVTKTCSVPHTQISSGGGSVSGWSNLSNGAADDNAYVTWTGTTKGKTTYYAKFKGFGFRLGGNAIIDGITVTIHRKGVATGTSATVSDQLIKLIDDTDAIAGNNNSTDEDWSEVESAVAFGSDTDLWGTAWTGAKVNDADFGVAIAAQTLGSGSGPFTYDFYIDYVTITISYTTSFTATSAVGGCWNDGATWGGASPGVVGTDYPGADNIANIPGGRSVGVCSGSAANCLTLNINSDQHVSLGATLSLADATSTFNVLESANMKSTSDAIASFATGTIQLNGGNFNVTGNLTVTADKNGSNLTSNVISFGGGTLSVDGNITMSSDNASATNTLNMTSANSTLDLAGSLTLGTGGVLSNGTGATGTVKYSGGAQTVLSAITYNNLTYDGGGLKTLDGNTTVKGTLEMINGNNNLAGSNLTLGTSTAAIGTLNHTAGTLYGGMFTRWFNTSTIADDSEEGLFPTGTSSDYRPFNVSMPTTGPITGGTLSIGHTHPGTPPATVSFPDQAATVQLIATKNWLLTAANSFSVAEGNLNVSTTATHMGSVGNIDDLRMTLVGSVIGTASVNSGSTTNPTVRRIGLPAFTASSHTFYWGSVNAILTPLPIELVSFDVTLNSNKVVISWITASEINNDYFTIERSSDGVNFEVVGTVKGNGNSTSVINYTSMDTIPYKGISYYRLKHTDFDGKSRYSDLEMLTLEKETDFSFNIFPNPNDGELFSLQLSDNDNEEVLVVVFNMLGKEIYSKVLITEKNSPNAHAIDLSQKLPAGVYWVTATSNNNIYNKRLIVN